ncbi:MAG: D-alanyl-D-alanine carboxypeptidase family protein [Terricaulis sp.]
MISRACLTALALLLILAAPAQAQRRRAPPMPAQHVVIMDAASGLVLSCEQCEAAVAPASMSKLMTVLLVLEALERGEITLETRYRVSEYAWRQHGAPSGGSHMFLPIHSEIAVRDLLRGAVIVSANDACVVLAEGFAGSEAAFVERMNRRARELRLRSAHFANATGVDDPRHVISTLDLARLARHLIVHFPDFYRTYGERSFTFSDHTQENRNPLLGAFDGADGVKTGHTDTSGYGMVGSATRGEQRRIIVFNGANSMQARRTEALRLMRSAFEDYTVTRLAAAGAQVGEAQVRLGDRRSVPLLAREDIYVGGPHGFQSGLSARLIYQGPLRAPIRRGALVASLVVEGPGFDRREFPLVAGRDIGPNWFSSVFEGLRLSLFGAE